MHTSPVDYVATWSAGLVAYTFILAGLSKLRSPDAVVAAFRTLQAPKLLDRRFFTVALPLAEAFLGLAWMFTYGVPRLFAGVITILVLVVFTWFLISAIHRDEQGSCNCFGALGDDVRITYWSVARNVALMVLTAVALLVSPHRGSMLTETLSGPPAWTLALMLGWMLILVALLIRRVATLSQTRETPSDLPVTGTAHPLLINEMGDAIPAAELVSGQGVTVPLNRLGRGAPVMLIFVSANCSSCQPVMRRIDEWQRLLGPLPIRVATSSRPDELEAALPGIARYARYGASGARAALGVTKSPAAVVLGDINLPVIASPVVYGLEEIDGLVHSLASARA
ncbi:hypothetical protein QF046_001424 [Microbacterium sp. W4I4]|uniref:MauE/DoxX family redox-associated membrane protein n=1 Tax=Microbacterium sp. W4I4 TaxID=3042295 RepID=UPI00278090CE|nr:MauE/DoxX family redox-associated membrane protein [Microbacterium sp. W4I4]MDQ0613783.1 hypothetical protein [Microbacterium sp. W4I4]